MDYEARSASSSVRAAEHRRSDGERASLRVTISTIFRPRPPGDGVTHRHGAGSGEGWGTPRSVHRDPREFENMRTRRSSFAENEERLPTDTARSSLTTHGPRGAAALVVPQNARVPSQFSRSSGGGWGRNDPGGCELERATGSLPQAGRSHRRSNRGNRGPENSIAAARNALAAP